MIPIIETIVESLYTGTVSKAQAVTWLHQHAADATSELRDMFAAAALQGVMANGDTRLFAHVAMDAYQLADAMLEARKC